MEGVNRLMLNDDKTEIIVIGRPKVLKNLSHTGLNFGNTLIEFSPCVRNLGVFIDNDLSMFSHVKHLIKIMYLEINRIGKIRHLITKSVAETLVSSLVLPKLDYCNSLLANISKDKIKMLQTVQNNAARMISKKSKRDSATSLLDDLHWLPVDKRCHYKICSLVYKSLNHCSPSYISDLLNIYVTSRSKRYINDNSKLIVPMISRKVTEQSFEFAAASFWNTLPLSIRSCETFNAFKGRLKTHLFQNWYLIVMFQCNVITFTSHFVYFQRTD